VSVVIHQVRSLSIRVSPSDIKDNGCTVKGPIEGRPYEFRVATINDAGVGAFVLTSEAVIPQSPESKPPFMLIIALM